MQGKKKDHQFISNFIDDCIKQNILSQEEILNMAQERINQIDAQIKEIENLKLLRSKLLDVVDNFSRSNKKHSDYKLYYYQISHPNIGKQICFHLAKSVLTIDNILGKLQEFDQEQIKFCIKQLLEKEIVYREDNFLLRGKLFNEYLVFLGG